MCPDAGGMIIASTRPPAPPTTGTITRRGRRPSCCPRQGVRTRIAAFAEGVLALVAVRMVSEGVDVPRLAVGVYATSASTRCSSPRRSGGSSAPRRPGETACIFLPSVPNLLLLASEMEAQRNHVLGPLPRGNSEDPLDAEVGAQKRDEPGEPEKGTNTSAPMPNWIR